MANTKKYDYLIVGTGLFGSVLAFLLGRDGKKCLIIDKRKHIGGNLYCEKIEGVNVHKYGAHIFHTSNKEVWDFVTSLTDFNNFTLTPIANYKGKMYNLPFNMNTFSQMWGITTPNEAIAKINSQKYNGEIHNLEEQALSLVGRDIYETLIKGYTEKQWGRKCSELPASIIKRLPFRLTYNNNYFNDKYQGIPVDGYNPIFEKLLSKSDVITDCDYIKNKDYLDRMAEKIIYTGKIDEFYDYIYGELEYRSVFFKEEILDVPNYQGVCAVNYTDAETPWTRIIEHKHFETFGDDIYKNPKTIISKEFSQEWCKGMEGYYPINNDRNNTRYEKYRALAEKEKQVVFGGRLADYKYYDMDDTIEQSIKLYRNLQN